MFGGRSNLVRKEFEEFLRRLNEAGAELIFVFKKTLVSYEDKWKEKKNKEYEDSQAFIAQLEEISNYRSLCCFYKMRFNSATTYGSDSSSILFHSALKFGTFHGSDFFLKNAGAAHTKLATELGVFAVIGLDTDYLFYDGSFKLWFPVKAETILKDSVVKFDIQKFIKQPILDHFEMDDEKFRLLAVLSGKFFGSLEASETLKRFAGIPTEFAKLAKFIHEQVEFPLTRQSIENIVEIIFDTVDQQVVQDFEKSLESFEATFFTSVKKFDDDEVNRLIKDDPFTYAELILNNEAIPIGSSFLEVNASDMKPMQDLTVPWIQRVMGLLLKHVDSLTTCQIIYRIDAAHWDKTEVEAIYPKCEISSCAISTTDNFAFS